jgi:hypothetical protein
VYRRRLEKKHERKFVGWARARPRRAMTRKMNGYGQKGWPDQLVVKPGARRILWLEFKDEDGGVSAIQEVVFGALAAAGQEVRVVETFDEARAVYDAWR